LNDDEVKSIVAFLKTLTGNVPEVTYPVLPPSTANTPKPVDMIP
jgi:cytochrome c peroxidase